MIELLNFDCEKYTLDNGLEVVLYPNPKLPTTAVNLWYKVGSANESPGKTGFAHLFEHMMFQGSENVGKEMHFKYVQEAGGSLNGSTSFDRTNYFETVPSNNLELALWLESDRMGFLLSSLTQEKLDNQKEVVMNERMQRYENQPYGLAWEKLFNQVFGENHPYSWPTIGYMDDIKKFNLSDVSDFFKKYYSPANASLTVTGNFERSQAKELIHRYFGPIKGNGAVEPIEFERRELSNHSLVIHEDNVELSRIYFAWKSEKLYGENDAALDIFSDVLGGSKNSRLNKSLVFDRQIAQDVSCFQYSGKLDGTFIVVVTAKPGIDLDEIKSEVFKVINSTISDVSEKEIQRAKNTVKSHFIYSLQNITSLADHMNGYNCNLGNPNSFAFDLERFESVDSEMVEHAAKNVFARKYAELKIIPKSNDDR